jgi:hypothetical protein
VLIESGPARVDITGLRAGDRNESALTIVSAGAPLDCSGATVRAQARPSPSSKKVMTAVITEVDASKGRYLLAWPGEDVRTMLAGAEFWSGHWDLELLEEGQTVPVTVAAGEISAVMDVTRDS